jgi:hypothetical protein
MNRETETHAEREEEMSSLKSKLLVGSLLVIALVGLSAKEAEALTNGGKGYVCSVKYSPALSSVGKYGYVYVTLYSSPGCGGTYLGYGSIYTTDAYNSAADPLYLYSQAQIIALAQTLQRAAAADQRVRWHVSSSTPTAIRYFYFYSGSY